VQPNAFCFWQYDTAGVTLWMDLRNGGEGVILSGRTLDVCEILFASYENCSAFSAGEQFCAVMSPSPKLADHVDYGANNWYYAYGKSSHEEILADTRLLSKLCEKNSNRPYMVIDDGWSPNPKNGPWTHGNDRFPDMKLLAEQITQENVRPGIWVRYIYDEKQVCGLPKEWHYPHDENFLDPSHPQVLAYIRETTRRFVDWGYRLIKFDCSTQDILGRRGYRTPNVIAPDGWHFYDRSKTSAEIILNFYKTIREAAGDDVVLLGCATISHLSAGIVEVGRTGADINGVDWDITRRMGVNTLAFRMMLDRHFFAVDADCVGITGKLPWHFIRQWLHILSISGTPLFVSCKPEILDNTQQEILRQAYQTNSTQCDRLIPLDWMENICPERWLHNDTEITFDWYDDFINAGFQSVSP
jgi:alpha-galactosidase